MMLSGGVVALGGVAAIASPRDGGPALGGARAGAAHGESHGNADRPVQGESRCASQWPEVLLEGDAVDDGVAAH